MDHKLAFRKKTIRSNDQNKENSEPAHYDKGNKKRKYSNDLDIDKEPFFIDLSEIGDLAVRKKIGVEINRVIQQIIEQKDEEKIELIEKKEKEIMEMRNEADSEIKELKNTIERHKCFKNICNVRGALESVRSQSTDKTENKKNKNKDSRLWNQLTNLSLPYLRMKVLSIT
ncbi:hypothetical protein F8M41_003213 [Gigaspora margarita]|uniref:Uncharacterized protein n=1 Tax=Gigaspora margarita TaxID=4874 RepID=A0A8H4A6P6_GIGMA|nr:hypothetical protein F8M41_003213 [Gigaspora margarita]